MTQRPGAPADITPVLVTYNSARILPWSLPMLGACAAVIVVDNGSRDATREVVASLLPQARFIAAGRNLGFGRANNLGLAAVTTDYALLHNPDARLDADALWALHDAARRYPEAAIIAPMLYDGPNTVGDFFRGPFYQRAMRPAPQLSGDVCTEFVSGAALLLNLRLMREVGFFDPWFFLYFEDDDLCLRVRRAGHPIMVAHAARIEHHVRQSSPASPRTSLRRAYCMTLSKLYITRKYLGSVRCCTLALRIGAGSLLALPIVVLSLRRERVLKHLARCGAALMAWRQLRRPHCFEPRE